MARDEDDYTKEKRPIGSQTDFRRHILLPQIAVFVALIAVGSGRNEGLPLLGIKFVAIAYLLGFGVYLHIRKIPFSYPVVGTQITILTFILAVMAAFARAPFLDTVLMPMAVIFGVILVVEIWVRDKVLKTGNSSLYQSVSLAPPELSISHELLASEVNEINAVAKEIAKRGSATRDHFVAQSLVALLGRSARGVVGAAASSLTALAHARFAIVAFGPQDIWLLDRGRKKRDEREDELAISSIREYHNFIESLAHRARKLGTVARVVTDDLGEDFEVPLRTLFRHRPKSMLVGYVREEGTSEYPVVIVPLKWWYTYNRIVKIIRSGEILIRGAAKINRTAKSNQSVAHVETHAHTHSQSLSKTKSGIYETRVTGIEEQFNSVIHLINNAAQEMVVSFDELKSILQVGDDETLSERKLTVIKKLMYLEGAITRISTTASDTKILNELKELKEGSRKELVSLKVIFDALEPLTAEMSAEKRGSFAIERLDKGDVHIQVVGREYLIAMVRSLVRELLPKGGKNSSAHLRATIQESAVSLNLEVEYPARMNEGTFFAARHLAEMSGGTCTVKEERSRVSLALSLSRGVPVPKRAVPKGAWILLVDDSEQVLTFYTRVAEALAVPYLKAESMNAAKQIVATHGEPRLVITDIQLGDGNGLTLVRELRAQFGPNLPFLVVSGDWEEGATGDMKSGANIDGHVRFLRKPVGRRALFDEITNILGRG